MTIKPLPDCVRAFYDAFVHRDPSLCAKAVSPTWENHPREPGQGAGIAAFEHTISMYGEALTDLSFEFERTISEGADIALRIRVRGTTTGRLCALVEARQHEPAGVRVDFYVHDIHTLAGDRIAESRHLEDWPTIFRQVGLSY